MFEVIISYVKTGRVDRKFFDTRDEAERFRDGQEQKLLYGRGSRKRTLRDFRFEIYHREPATIHTLPAREAAAAAA